MGAPSSEKVVVAVVVMAYGYYLKDLKITWHLSKMFNIKVCSKRDWLFFKSNIIFITPGQHEELQIRAICHDLVNDAWRTKWLAISLVLKLFLYHSYTIKQTQNSWKETLLVTIINGCY